MAIISISDSQVNGADQILVADSNSKIPAKDGSQITILNATNVTTGTIASARLDVGTTANKLVQLDGSGNLPAVDASQLTGIVSATISASDPTISTNPSGGVGTEWLNSTSGDMYICTDATAGENVWTNVGAGTGNIIPYQYQGSNYGYCAGGWVTPKNTIDKYSLTSDANATDVGDILSDLQGHGGNSSTTYGYVAGGYPQTVTIQKFSFSSDGNAVDSGQDLTVAREGIAGHSTEDYGYCSGGSPNSNIIERYPFASSANATDVGDMHHSSGSTAQMGLNSETYGFYAGQDNPDGNVIGRFAFASSANGADVGDLTVSRSIGAGCSDTDYGYCAGGYATSDHNQIDRFQFVASSNATDVGDLTVARRAAGNASTTAYGYVAGGSGVTNVIDKFQFQASGNATDIADLTLARHWISSSHY